MKITHKVNVTKGRNTLVIDCYSQGEARAIAERESKCARVVTIATDAGIKDGTNHGLFVLDEIFK